VIGLPFAAGSSHETMMFGSLAVVVGAVGVEGEKG